MFTARRLNLGLIVCVLFIYTLTSVQSAPAKKKSAPTTKAPSKKAPPTTKAPKTTKPPPTPKPPKTRKLPKATKPPQPTPPPTTTAPLPDCKDIVCLAVTCANPVLNVGECCPTCPATSCDVFGETIPVGETRNFADGMYCGCEADGSAWCVA
ncbi:uncharacterized protein LOC131936162 [Physella acuta]|uniref:uncharacterized protein LOC131936162 n=1 Tax=Physella acuta TaxID=109671 RepID=UPI0027DBC440|nr:uncharacterized protein LOC131936162 [Physella acuta]